MSLFPVLLSDVTVMGQRYTEIGGALFCQWMLAFLSIFFQPYTRQLVYSIVTSLSCVGIFNNHCYKFTTKADSERILENGQHFTKIRYATLASLLKIFIYQIEIR